MTYTATAADKTITYNTSTLKITVFNKKRNTVYSVLPTIDWEHWDMLVSKYFNGI
jgi:hypothetical protein